MNIKYIEHIGIAVKSIEVAKKYYEDVLGLYCYAIEEVKDQKVKTAFFKIGDTKIELLEPTDPESPVAKFIEKRGEGIHHIAFAVKDIESSIKELQAKGVQMIDQNPRMGAEGLHIAFIHPKSSLGVLTEICENKSE